MKAFHVDEPPAARRGGDRRAREVARQPAADRGRPSLRAAASACARRFRSASTTSSPTSARRAARTPPPTCRTIRCFSRRYGRIILMRENIMKNPDLFANAAAALERRHGARLARGGLAGEGGFQRTLWHEIGHYLGPERDARRARPRSGAPGWADAVEEMKSDLVSLFAMQRLADAEARDARAPRRGARQRHPPRPQRQPAARAISRTS